MGGEDLWRQVTERLRDWLTETDHPVVAAVSGGVDSMVLLHLLRGLCAQMGRSLWVAHVQHGLRTTAALDQQLVQETCTAWGVPCVVRTVQLSSLPPHERRGVEADARRLRYRALVEVAREVGACQVYLAHHADDQLETILWRLLRGTSLTGIGGIRPRSWREGVEWLRPLLDLDKSHLYEYARRQQVPFREDESNLSTEFTRNYLRHEVLPRLRQIQPQAATMAARFAEVVQDEDEWLEAQAERAIATCTVRRGKHFVIDCTRFSELPRPLQRRTVKILLYCLASVEWTLQHIDAVVQLVQSANPSARLSLPRGLGAERDYGVLRLGSLDEARSPASAFQRCWRLADGASLTVAVGGRPRWRFDCRIWQSELGLRSDGPWELRLPAVDELWVRSPRTGDRVRLFGRPGHKKLQDVFVDAKVPRRLRPLWPVVGIGDDIVWVPGVLRAGVHLLQPKDTVGWRITCQSLLPAGALADG
jgi:tRNA(Ile)-lysidine synthase